MTTVEEAIHATDAAMKYMGLDPRDMEDAQTRHIYASFFSSVIAFGKDALEPTNTDTSQAHEEIMILDKAANDYAFDFSRDDTMHEELRAEFLEDVKKLGKTASHAEAVRQ